MISRNRGVTPLATWLPDRRGQGLVEYALILVLVAVIVIAILLLLGPKVGSVFSRVADELLHPGSPIEEVSVTTPGSSVHVFVTVSRSTTVTVTLPGKPSKSATFEGTYEFVFGDVSGSGTGTVTAGGYSETYSY